MKICVCAIIILSVLAHYAAALPQSENLPELPQAVLAHIARQMDVETLKATHKGIKNQLRDPSVRAAVLINTFGVKAAEKAAEMGVRQPSVFEAILRTDQSVDGRRQAIRIAAVAGRKDFIRQWRLDQDDREWIVALEGAAESGNATMADWLLAFYDVPKQTAWTAQDADQIYQIAARYGNDAFMADWIRSNSKRQVSEFGVGAVLANACAGGHLDTASRILQGDFGPVPTSDEIFEAAKEAVKNGRLAMIKFLLPRLVMLPIDTRERSALMTAAIRHDRNDIFHLLYTQPYITDQDAQDYYRAAASHHNSAVMRVIFATRPQVISIGYYGLTFVYACQSGDLDVVKAFMDHIRPSQFRVNEGLEYALGNGHTDVARYLLNEAPKRAHSLRQRQLMKWMRTYRDPWVNGVGIALQSGEFERAKALWSQFKMTQREFDTIFGSLTRIDARHYAYSHDLKPTIRGIDLALANSESLDAETVRDLVHGPYGVQPSQNVIDAAFGNFESLSAVQRYYDAGLRPSSSYLMRITREYVRGSLIDVEALLANERDRLPDILRRLRREILTPEAHERINHLSARLITLSNTQ